jgi:hypothetical protein
MRRQNESIGELLFKAPWWISALLGVVSFAALRWGVPAWAGTDNSPLIIAKAIIPLAPAALFVFAVFAAASSGFPLRVGYPEACFV